MHIILLHRRTTNATKCLFKNLIKIWSMLMCGLSRHCCRWTETIKYDTNGAWLNFFFTEFLLNIVLHLNRGIIFVDILSFLQIV